MKNILYICEILDNILDFISWMQIYKLLNVNKIFKKTCEYNMKKRQLEEYKIWKNQKIKYRKEKNNWIEKRKFLKEFQIKELDEKLDNTWNKWVNIVLDDKIEENMSIFYNLIEIYNEGGKLNLLDLYDPIPCLLDNKVYNYFRNIEFNSKFIDIHLKIFEIISISGNSNTWAYKYKYGNIGSESFMYRLIKKKYLIQYPFYYHIFETIIFFNDEYNYETDIIYDIYLYKLFYNYDIKYEEIQLKIIRLLCYNKKIRYRFYNLCNEYIEDRIQFRINKKNLSLKMVYKTYNTLMFMYENKYIKKIEYKKILCLISHIIKINLNSFLFNKNIRKFLIYLLQNIKLRKILLKNYPEIIFELCKKREKNIFINFVKLELNTIKKLKYKNTNENIYSFSLKQKGCMQNIIKYLKKMELDK